MGTFEENPGEFSIKDSLTRNSKTIKQDRADEILESILITGKRKVEDLELQLTKLLRKKRSLVDLSPNTTFTIISVEEFEKIDLFERFCELNAEIRNKKIAINVARKSYNELSGSTTYDFLPVEN